MCAARGLCCPLWTMMLGILFTWLLPQLADSVIISLQPKDNITILIKPGVVIPPPTNCYICSAKSICKSTNLEIRPGMTVDYSFACSTPEKFYVMEIQRRIDCNTGLCPFGKVQLEPPGLTGLNRTFFWHVETAQNMGIELNFSTPWLSQIDPSYKCPDSVTYKVNTTVGRSSINVGTFCRSGTVSRIKVQGGGVVALNLPWNETLTGSGFSIANRSSIKRLCIIESTFQSQSDAILMSADYPVGFPNDDLMTWQFVIPVDHSASVEFLNYTFPSCERKTERVEYYLPNYNYNPEVLALDNKQPANIAGNFNLSLQNCDLDSQKQQGLTLLFKVTVQKTPTQGSKIYNIDLTKEKDITVTIMQRPKPKFARQFVPICKICKAQMDCDQEFTMTGGKFYRISFLCHDLNVLMATAVKTIACWNLKACNINNEPLSTPPSLLFLPIQLEIIWNLLAPKHISTEIASSSMKLHQLVSNNATDEDFFYSIVSSDNKSNFQIGTFRPVGPIKKVQLRDNVTITLILQSNRNLSHLPKMDLHISFVSRIEEECIITVVPAPDSTVTLQTPNWEKGLPDSVSVSWNIAMPAKQFGKLAFAKDKMDIMCDTGRAFINIKEQKSTGPDIVLKDYDTLPSSINLFYPFWLNISNCKPKFLSNKLQIQFSVMFTQTKSDLTTILIAACSAIAAVILIIGVAVYCVRKKKKEKKAPVGIYNTKPNTELSKRQRLQRKGRKNKESHVYAVIDDTMVYGHLLKDTSSLASPDANVDVYQPFQGPMGEAPPVPPLNRISKDKVDDDPLASSMRLNEFYSFNKSELNEPIEHEDTSLDMVDQQENGPVLMA
ncbi:CUB domain-containing protein 1 isoform X2 [Xenopus laevis]|uniref:CUB domain-containing protein 1 n=2 Tax=Xenopus laevis TaxID=8355 RepID=A0A974HFT1_XENLA|nr:CUB domain-containing protein 1 isoform X2 [Xenopus laevis]OCT75976.1 hypothetical protein XELAEV_18031163mg [Xenopus laevis]